MEKQYQILRQLAKGEALSDTPELQEVISDFNLETNSKGGQVELTQPLELLDPVLLQKNLSDEAKQVLSSLDLHWSLDSTNTFVLNLSREDQFHGYACMAEQQTAGKGRRGRNWVSPFGKNIYLSLGWRLESDRNLEGLSLAVGCACTRAISKSASDVDVALKWPNDLLIAGGKAGGILVELGHGPATHHHLVIGVGINLQLSESDSREIDQPWSVVRKVSRNMLAGQLVTELAACLSEFSKDGFEPFQQEWNARDGYSGESVRLLSAGSEVEGIARGVDSNGNLLLEVDGEIRLINAGEVSMRATVI